MGLFDGGFDMDALMKMIGPGAANAAGAPSMPDASSPDFSDRFGASFPNAEGPAQLGPGQAPPPTNGLPVEPPPNNIVTMNAGAPSPVAPDVSNAAPRSVGAALTGLKGQGVDDLESRAPLPGAEGPTAPSPQTPAAEDKRPSLAQALRGAQMPAAPVQQKISSPNAPRPSGTIQSGQLMALLQALNAGGAGVGRPTLGRG